MRLRYLFARTHLAVSSALPLVSSAVKPRSAQQSNEEPPCSNAFRSRLEVSLLTPVIRRRLPPPCSQRSTARLRRSPSPVNATIASAFIPSAVLGLGKVTVKSPKPIP